MPRQSSRINITSTVTLDVNTYVGCTWVHIRRKDKSVSLPLKDFVSLINKRHQIKKITQKYERGGKKSKSKRDDFDTSECTTDSDTD